MTGELLFVAYAPVRGKQADDDDIIAAKIASI
jgi:hypothetical protein